MSMFRSHNDVLYGSSPRVLEAYKPSMLVQYTNDTVREKDGRVTKSRVKRLVPAGSQFSQFKVNDFSVESLSETGAIGQMNYVTLSDYNIEKSLSNIDRLMDVVDAASSSLQNPSVDISIPNS